MMSKAMPDAKITPKNVWAAGDYVIAETEMTGTLKGAIGPIKPTNKTGTIHMVDVALVKDGKMAHGWAYGSSAEFANAFGLMKPKAPPPTFKATGAQVPAAGSTAPKAAGTAKPGATPAKPATVASPGSAPAKPAT